MACGDGVYCSWLAERVGFGGRVAAVDVVPEYLAIARKKAVESPLAAIIDFSLAPIDALPFDDDTFDFCWCAQSLYSLPDPVDAVRHMLRVSKPGGTVAVLEGDTLHHMILPWPIKVELAGAAAELQFLAKKSDNPDKFYVGRHLRSCLSRSGSRKDRVANVRDRSSGALGPNERTYFTLYLRDICRRIASHLDGPTRAELDRLVEPDSGEFLLDDPDFTATCIDHVVWGVKPTTARQRGV